MIQKRLGVSHAGLSLASHYFQLVEPNCIGILVFTVRVKNKKFGLFTLN